MANIEITQESNKKRFEKTDLIRKTDDGLELLRVTVAKAEQLKRLESFRFNNYFDATQTPVTDPEERKRRAFLYCYEKTACLLCGDVGTHNVPMKKMGKIYEFAFACTCDKGIAFNIASIADLMPLGTFDSFCRLGGEDGSYCHLSEKKPKCWQVRCSKFGGI